jgi:GTP:adenosylcobinamide-phosphate guanylyltransferase
MYAVSGVNIINGKKILSEGKIDTAALITEEVEVLFNINTKKDLEIAKKFLKKTN